MGNQRHIEYAIRIGEAKWWLMKAETGHREASHRDCLEHAWKALGKAIALVPLVPAGTTRPVHG